jgi:predicted nucleotidyltransferase
MGDNSNNVFAGTQVVAIVEVRGANQSLVHPRGAVGVVTRTPTGTEKHYLVRFPDGFEASLTREQMEILKHFKDRLGASSTVSAKIGSQKVANLGTGRPSSPLPSPPTKVGEGAESGSSSNSASTSGSATVGQAEAMLGAPFELEPLIIYRCVVGSRAYGLETEGSDTDLRGVYLAPAELQWSLFGAPEQFEDNASQSCYWELQKFIIMALKANPNILECLYSPLVEKNTPLGEELLAMRGSFLSQMIFQTFNGYALSQFKKIEQDRRNQGEVRWKHAMHLLRLLLTGAAALREGRVPVRVEHHRDRLLSVKRGDVAWSEVDAWRKELHKDFERALAETKLPERPDYERANEFLIGARKQATIAKE